MPQPHLNRRPQLSLNLLSLTSLSSTSSDVLFIVSLRLGSGVTLLSLMVPPLYTFTYVILVHDPSKTYSKGRGENHCLHHVTQWNAGLRSQLGTSAPSQMTLKTARVKQSPLLPISGVTN